MGRRKQYHCGIARTQEYNDNDDACVPRHEQVPTESSAHFIVVVLCVCVCVCVRNERQARSYSAGDGSIMEAVVVNKQETMAPKGSDNKGASSRRQQRSSQRESASITAGVLEQLESSSRRQSLRCAAIALDRAYDHMRIVHIYVLAQRSRWLCAAIVLVCCSAIVKALAFNGPCAQCAPVAQGECWR